MTGCTNIFLWALVVAAAACVAAGESSVLESLPKAPRPLGRPITDRAAWTALGSFCLTFLLALYLSNRLYPLKYEWGKLFKIFSLMMGAFFAVQLLKGEHLLLNVLLKSASILLFLGITLGKNYGNLRDDLVALVGLSGRSQR